MSFSDLKKKSSLGSITSKLLNEVEKMNSNSGGADDRIWKPEVDKAGNGFAVIRFLPAPEGEELPWAKVYTHAFQGTGGWLIDNCLTTINQSCPVCEANRELWNTGSKANQDIVRQRKRKLSYYSNIYVVSDKAHPENEGKVFLFKYGKKIFDKISAAMKPEFDDETPIDPFDFWGGANFKVKITKKDGYWNYDKSEFDSPSTLGNFEDDVLESIWKNAYSLEEFVAPDTFKTYEQLDSRLKAVLGKKPIKQDESFEDEDDNAPPLTEDLRSELNALSSNKSSFEDEDDTLSYFARLAEE